MKIVKEINKEKSLKNLLKMKDSHSKVRNIKHDEIKLQRYLEPNEIIRNREDAQLIFKLRCQMTNLKVNMKGKYDNVECRACKKENESQKHVFECNAISVKLHEKETYEELLDGSLRQKIKLSEIMKKRIDKLQEIEKLQ